MADRYVDRDYVEATLGAKYIASSLAETGRDLDVLIEQGTAVVRGALKNSGYAQPVSSDGVGVEEIVKLAVVGQMIELLATAPGTSVPLPENWENSPYRKAFDQIVSGELQLDADPESLGAVGGFGLQRTATTERRTTADEMDVW